MFRSHSTNRALDTSPAKHAEPPVGAAASPTFAQARISCAAAVKRSSGRMRTELRAHEPSDWHRAGSGFWFCGLRVRRRRACTPGGAKRAGRRQRCGEGAGKKGQEAARRRRAQGRWPAYGYMSYHMAPQLSSPARRLAGSPRCPARRQALASEACGPASLSLPVVLPPSPAVRARCEKRGRMTGRRS